MNNNNGHIISSYNNELSKLRSHISKMSQLCISQMQIAMDAIRNSDKSMARKVIDNDQEIDNLETSVEELVIRILALRHPVAGDLRNVIASLKISTDLERIADYATNMSKRVLLMDNPIPSDLVDLLDKMSKLVCSHLEMSIEAFYNNDDKLARKIWLDDKKIDKYHDEFMRIAFSYATSSGKKTANKDNKKNTEEYAYLLFIAKNLERAGDHISNIAEMVFFRAKGKTFDARKI